MFRMTQNGSKMIQRVKKAKNAPIFSKHAEEILTLFDLTHLCTNFVLVFIYTDTFWPHSCITSPNITYSSYLVYCCCCIKDIVDSCPTLFKMDV